VRIERVSTPGCDGTTYGDAELLGPVLVAAAYAAAALRPQTSSAARSVFRIPLLPFPPRLTAASLGMRSPSVGIGVVKIPCATGAAKTFAANCAVSFDRPLAADPKAA
jgi:hypothetical protein